MPSTLKGFVKITAFGFLQSKEEVMAVRLREADNIAAMAELQQQISELEIQVNIVFLTEIQFFETFQGFTEEVPDLSETVKYHVHKYNIFA